MEKKTMEHSASPLRTSSAIKVGVMGKDDKKTMEHNFISNKGGDQDGEKRQWSTRTANLGRHKHEHLDK